MTRLGSHPPSTLGPNTRQMQNGDVWAAAATAKAGALLGVAGPGGGVEKGTIMIITRLQTAGSGEFTVQYAVRRVKITVRSDPREGLALIKRSAT